MSLAQRPGLQARPIQPVAKNRSGVLGKVALVLGPLLVAADAMDITSLLQEGANVLMTHGVYDEKAEKSLERYALWGGATDFQAADLNDFYALPMGIKDTVSSIVAGRGYLPEHDLNLQMAFAYEVPQVGADWSEVVDHSRLFVELSQADGGDFVGCFYVNQGHYKTDLSFEELLAQEIDEMEKLGADGMIPQCTHAGGGKLVATR